MKTMVLLLPHRKPDEVWKRGINYAKQYDAELIALLLIKNEDDLAPAQKLLTRLLTQATQNGITVSGEIVVDHKDFDLFNYKSKYEARLLII